MASPPPQQIDWPTRPDCPRAGAGTLVFLAGEKPIHPKCGNVRKIGRFSAAVAGTDSPGLASMDAAAPEVTCGWTRHRSVRLSTPSSWQI